ncbi:MAG: PaaI family thioesterase [Terriglobales bacterium]
MNPAKAAKVRHIFDNAPFIREMGVELTSIEDGWCETQLVPEHRHRQQHGLIHAGVMASMCDHTAGCAARGKVGMDQDVLTVEFKINFLRPAVAERLRCRSQVLRAGKTLVVCESELYAQKKSEEKLVAKATVTLAVTGEVASRITQ